jgi:hypothetical protein
MYITIYIIGFIVFWIIFTYIDKVSGTDDRESRFISLIVVLAWPLAIPIMIGFASLYVIAYIIDKCLDKFIAYMKNRS